MSTKLYYPGLTKFNTKPILYQKILLAKDSSTREHLTELSAKRKAIEESINETRSTTEPSASCEQTIKRDIEKVEAYLPLLENLVQHLNVKAKNRTILCWISGLKIRWSSVLTSSSKFHFGGPKLYQVDDIHFELGMILFLYAAMLREQALKLLSSSDLVQSASTFRKAAGVYSYLANEVLIYFSPDEDMIPEATPQISSVMSLICLAEAQAVIAKRGEESGKSTGALSKIHYGVAEILVEATDILQQVTTKHCKEISSLLLDYILSYKTLHELKCYKYIVEGLDKNDDRVVSVAVGVLRRALLNANKSKPKEESLRLVLKKEIVDDLTALLGRYERQNEFLWHGKVPCDSELPLPRGARMVSLIPYQPQKSETKLVFNM